MELDHSSYGSLYEEDLLIIDTVTHCKHNWNNYNNKKHGYKVFSRKLSQLYGAACVKSCLHWLLKKEELHCITAIEITSISSLWSYIRVSGLNFCLGFSQMHLVSLL
jgi:hypothetical protein